VPGAQIWLTLVSAGSAHFYGAFPVWSFGARAARHFGEVWWPLAPCWGEVLVSETANDLVHVRKLIDADPLHTLEPDPRSRRSAADPDAPTVSSSRDGSLTVAYVRQRRAVELARPAQVLSGFAARRLDPRAEAWTEATGTPVRTASCSHRPRERIDCGC
jgi:hypothetical protein